MLELTSLDGMTTSIMPEAPGRQPFAITKAVSTSISALLTRDCI